MRDSIYRWLKDSVCNHRVRLLAGLLLFIVELSLYFGSGVMMEDEVNYLTGEGSWVEGQQDGANSFTQAFIPEYKNLVSLSFLMDMENVSQRDGEVAVLVSDEENTIFYKEALDFAKISDGHFTDVEVNLRLSPRKTYYLTLVTTPSSAGEYPKVGLVSKSYYMPENQMLIYGDELPDIQLVSRYQYRALPFSKIRNIIFICMLTALGVIFGLPDNKWVRRVVGAAILLGVPYVLGSRLEMLTYKESFYLPISMKWNVGLMYALELLVLLCTHSPRIAIVLTNTGLTLLYSANYFVLMYRGTCLRMNDFTAAGTAVKVVGNYSFVPNDHLAFAWGLLIMFVVFGVQTGDGKTERKNRALKSSSKGYRTKKLISYLVSIFIAVMAVLYGGYKLIYTNFLEQVGFWDRDLNGFSQELIYSFNGYLVATCIEVKNSRILPPDGYSVDRVEELLAAGVGNREDVGEELPHVILIMNESFSDLRILGELELNQENMHFFDALTENAIRGYVNASVLGGGTANSEFEVLTGCNMAFFSANYYPYQQGIKRPINSLVSSMQENGYTSISMHPANATNWNRGSVYKHYGFDKSLWKDDFAGAEKIHRGVSDAETYRKIIELYENREGDEKLFLFDVTIQNHGGYPGENGPYEVQSERMKDEGIDEYLSLVKISDEAFADLVCYFEKQDEKVVICMFGDHQPWFSSMIVNVDKGDPNLDPDKLMSMYKTPFVIWANYDIEEADGYDISMNYLGGVLLRTAGIPLSPYFAYLENLREDYPIITVNGYVDSEGNYNSWSGAGNEFPEYRMLQYNYLFDKNIVDWGF